MEKIKDKIEAFNALDLKGKLIIIIPYLFSIFLCSRIAELYRLCSGNFVKIIKNIEYLYKAIPRFALTDLLIGIPAGFFIVWYIKWENGLRRKNTRKGVEYGSARWGSEKDIKPFVDPDPFYNVILSKTERLSMSPKMKKFNLNRNKNVIVYGSSGSGKTFSFVKPNLMQMHSSFVITDPKGHLAAGNGKYVCKKWIQD